MSEKIVSATTKDGLVISIDTDPNYVPATEYQDEDGYWVSEEDEEEGE